MCTQQWLRMQLNCNSHCSQCVCVCVRVRARARVCVEVREIYGDNFCGFAVIPKISLGINSWIVDLTCYKGTACSLCTGLTAITVLDLAVVDALIFTGYVADDKSDYLSRWSLGSEPISRLKFMENSHLICVTALVEALQGQEMWVFTDGPEYPMDAMECRSNMKNIRTTATTS